MPEFRMYESEPFQLTCPDCGDIFEADKDCIIYDEDTKEVIIECPSCEAQQVL